MPANRRLWSLAEALVNPNHGTPLSARMPVLSRRVGERCSNRAAAEGVITRNRSGTENHTDGQLWREVADVMRPAEGDTGLVAGKLSGTKDRGDPAHGKVTSPAVQRGIAVCGARRTLRTCPLLNGAPRCSRRCRHLSVRRGHLPRTL